MGKYKNSITILVILIAIIAFSASLAGLFSGGGNGPYEFKSIHGEMVKIQGIGLYKDDSVSVAAQGLAADGVTLVLGIPLMLGTLYFSIKGSFKARLMLTGTLGYFLYTYMSYVFLWMYNPFFIIYVILMSFSLYAFILSMMSFNLEKVPLYFKRTLPVRFLGGFQIFVAISIGMLWLGKIAPSIFQNTVPIGLEHYTTLVIQGMDLGIVVPTAFLSGVLLIKRKAFGYLLSSVIIFKSITMLTAISAMIINMALKQVQISFVEIIIFSLFNVLAILSLFMLLNNINSDPSAIQ